MVSPSPVISLLAFKAALSAAPGLSWCLTLQRLENWRGRRLPDSQLLELVCPSPSWALSKAGCVSLMASPGTYDIKRASPMEPRFGEFTEQPLLVFLGKPM